MKWIVIVAAFATLVGLGILLAVLWWRVEIAERKKSELNQFWSDTIGSVQPDHVGQPVTIAEFLSEADRRADLVSEVDPELEAGIRAAIGNGYRNLAQFERAQEQLQKSLEIRKRLHQPEHADVIESMTLIALLRRNQGEYERAREILRATVATCESALGENHRDVATQLQTLGQLEMETGNLAEADAHFQRARKIRERLFEYDHLLMANIMFDQASVASLRGDWINAEDLHTKALWIRRKRLPKTAAEIVLSVLALSHVYRHISESHKAKSMALEALDLRKAVLPVGHPLIREVEEWLAELEQIQPDDLPLDRIPIPSGI